MSTQTTTLNTPDSPIEYPDNKNEMNFKLTSRRSIKRKLPLWKRVVPHILLVLGVIVYLAAGAFVFQYLEMGDSTQTRHNYYNHPDLEEFVAFVRETFPKNSSLDVELKLESLLKKLYKPRHSSFDNWVTVGQETNGSDYDIIIGDDNMLNWNFWSSVLFAFTAVSTIGYGHIYPTTDNGRIFCVCYTIIGIPLFMITVADIGKFIWEGFAFFLDFLREKICCCWRTKSTEGAPSGGVSGAGDLSLAVSAPLISVAFAIYITFGAFLLPHWEKMDFFQASYFCFISVTTVGFGDVIPQNASYLIPTLLYIFFGLALTTLAIEVLAAAFRRVHYLGTQIKSEKAKIWLGDKLMSINDLVRSVARELGATESDMLKIEKELDQVLEDAAEELEEKGEIRMNTPVPREKENDDIGASCLDVADLGKKRFSGLYDNIPESWAQFMPFMDDDATRFIVPIPNATLASISDANCTENSKFV